MRFSLWAGFALTTALAGAAVAASDTAVVTVGPESISGPDLARRLGRVPEFQLARYGDTPAAQRKAFVDKVIVPELLFAASAKEQKLEERPGVHDRLRDAAKDALERALREDPAIAAAVTPEAIKNYFESNKGRFETPRRIRVWRILVGDEAVAKQIIADAKGTEGPKRWTEHAREKSLDKATSLRNGDLGFVRPDGSTDAPRVKVDPALFAAADKLKDGEVAPQPLREGDKFAVIWRRGSMPESKRTLKDEERSIRQLLERKEAERRRKELLVSLKQKELKEVHPELLELIDTQAFGPPPKRRVDKRKDPERRPPKLKAPPQRGKLKGPPAPSR